MNAAVQRLVGGGFASSGRTRGGVLFVVPTGERNGATTSLLHFLRWFRANVKRPFSVLLAGQGELVAECGQLADTWPADRSHWCPGGLRSQVLKKVGMGEWGHRGEKRDLRRFAERCFPGLVYVNSVTTEGARLAELLGLAVPVLTQVHELEYMLHLQAGKQLPQVLSATSYFIACSDAVRDNLVRRHGVAPQQIETVHESIPVAEMRAERTRQEVLRELQIPEDALIVMGCGTLDWRKGADLFVQLGRMVIRQRSGAYFAWIGGFPFQIPQFEHDIRVSQLAERVRFTGGVAKPSDYLAAADVFVLPSREDPFPLACLEAAALGKPIICFADAGGMSEFVEEDCGYVVPYLDVAAMADRVFCLLDSPERRLKMGAAARRKVTQRHDISVAGPRIVDIIDRTIAGA